MHSSVQLDLPIEFIDVTPINPLISKCQIKVCYVGDEPNRNRSIITKDVARQMANSLPGSPIVGFFNEETNDFEEHNRAFEIKDGQFRIKDTTRPYGFIDLNAKVWFATYLDDNQVQREYLVTEGWLWTGQYPECQRILERTNNQSMELDEKTLNATWTKDNNASPKFFIINEAIISKLCILGEDVEPCFEGANISKPTIQFSFEEGFKERMFSMMNELTELLNKGGASEMTVENMVEPVVEETVEVVEETVEVVTETTEPVVETAVDAELPAEAPVVEEQESAEETPVVEPEVVEEVPAAEFAETKEEEKCPECGKSVEECTCEEDKTEKYNLEEIPEYIELKDKYSALESEIADLKAAKEALEAQIAPLAEFKAKAEKAEKEAMINSFYMLSDEDKKDVVENIDSYSLDDIEAKLSIICVRNKVSFDLDDDKKPVTGPTVYNLNGTGADDFATPAWVKAALTVAKNMN